MQTMRNVNEKWEGFHYLRSWDGSHRGVVRVVKDQLDDQ